MAEPIKYYHNLLSQPSRALYILFKVNNITFDDNPVELRSGAHLTDEFKEVNRFQKVPCIVDNQFKLSESIAILRYLTAKGAISEKWYPTDLQCRARTDEYLEWQHNNTRMTCAMYFQLKWLRPLMTGKEPDEKRLNEVKKLMENVLDTIENTWLGDNKFITGNSINVADIFAVCEIEQTRMAGYDASEGRPKLGVWMKAVKDATNPYYKEAHKFVDKIAEVKNKM